MRLVSTSLWKTAPLHTRSWQGNRLNRLQNRSADGVLEGKEMIEHGYSFVGDSSRKSPPKSMKGKSGVKKDSTKMVWEHLIREHIFCPRRASGLWKVVKLWYDFGFFFFDMHVRGKRDDTVLLHPGKLLHEFGCTGLLKLVNACWGWRWNIDKEAADDVMACRPTIEQACEGMELGFRALRLSHINTKLHDKFPRASWA